MTEYFQKKQLIQESRFNIRQGGVPGQLARSVQRAGVIVPLIVTGGEKLVVLDGYRRLSLLNDEDTVPVHVIADIRTALRAVVELNMLASPYSEMEKAQIVVTARESLCMEDEEILNTLLPRLGLKGRQTVLDSCLAVRSLEKKLSTVLAARKAPLKFAGRLAREHANEQLTLAEFFSTHRFSLSQMIQAYDLLVPVRKRENGPFSTIIESLGKEDGTMLNLLWCRRFPRATEIRMKLNTLLMGYRGKLTFPDDMEGDAFRFSCLLKCPEEARKCIALLQEISEDDALFHFLAEYVGDD